MHYGRHRVLFRGSGEPGATSGTHPRSGSRPGAPPPGRPVQGREAMGPAWVLALVLPLLLLPLSPRDLAAQRSLAIEDFHATIRVDGDGEVEVTERITARFTGSWNGIRRLIPIEYRTPQGFSYRLRLDVASVTDGEGRELRVESGRERHYRELRIWVPGASDATRTVEIAYRVPNALKFFEDHDELYWNVTGDEWEVPIASASAEVHLPPGLTGLRAAAFTGGYGSREMAARIEEREQVFYFSTTRPLNFREGLTVAVAWEPGVVRRPGFLDRVLGFLRSNGLLVFPLVLGLGMYRLWDRRGRDPERRAVMPEYRPPEGLGPALAGTLVDHRPDMRDVIACIVDLAVRGYLRIEEIDRSGIAALLDGDDYRFVRLRSPEGGLEPYEAAVLEGLFEGGRDTVRLSELEHEFYTRLPAIRDGIFARLVALGHYARRPDHVRVTWVAIGIAVGVVGVAVGGFLASALAVAPQTGILAGVLSGLVVLGFGLFMPARTAEGTRALESVLGFQEFMERVEEDRFRRMIDTPEKFEAYLPYAMALGVEKRWARAFQDIFKEPPRWYVGSDPGGFRTTSFVAQLGGMSSRAGTVLASQPRSSGGSAFGGGGGGGGFSGGGFSGGGFGGGGGGGF